MIMAGYEWRGEKPFQNVYLTGIVRDKLGRKMSKSLGNSPDPIDLIEKYSADGVRAGMLFCSPAGNDLPFDESLCEQGRNFANKIWNAFRLVYGWSEYVNNRPLNPTETLALRWLEARVESAKLEMENLFDRFRISEALMSVYKLIWDDFCSWFLELMKPAREEGMSRQALETVKNLFEEVLKLLHPFMPFITEEIWQSLRNRDENDYLMVAQLAGGKLPENAETVLKDMETARESVTALRGFRADKNLSFKQALPVKVKTNRPDWVSVYEPILKKLVNTESVETVETAPAGWLSVVVSGFEFLISAAGTIDIVAESQKLEAEIAYTEGFRNSVLQKLSNEKFVANAKPDLVERERQKLADADAKLATLLENLKNLRVN
jgi:valyl-tRNA synthetase